MRFGERPGECNESNSWDLLSVAPHAIFANHSEYQSFGFTLMTAASLLHLIFQKKNGSLSNHASFITAPTKC